MLYLNYSAKFYNFMYFEALFQINESIKAFYATLFHIQLHIYAT